MRVQSTKGTLENPISPNCIYHIKDSPLALTLLSLAGDVMVGNLILQSATFTVISNLETERSRVAIVRSDRSAGVCFECQFPSDTYIPLRYIREHLDPDKSSKRQLASNSLYWSNYEWNGSVRRLDDGDFPIGGVYHERKVHIFPDFASPARQEC